MDNLTITLHVDGDSEARLHIADVGDVGLSIGTEYIDGHAEEYTGEYEFTPTQSTQTVEIKDKLATDNIVINPIPNYYGLITWNGSVLRVS